MRVNSIVDYLAGKSYPGRTICLSYDKDIKLLYFIMGRSANSQNRIFVKEEDRLRTEAFDPAKLEDPSLIIYNLYRAYEGRHILTNGDQTDTIYEGYADGRSMYNSLLTRRFEPDAPNFTPRISLVLSGSNYAFNIIKAGDPAGEFCNHFQFNYELSPGCGHCIHTYMDDGDPLPSFTGEPVAFPATDNLARELWESINSDYKVSLTEISIDAESGKVKDLLIFNKLEGD